MIRDPSVPRSPLTVCELGPAKAAGRLVARSPRGAATVPPDHAWMMVTGWGGGGAPGQVTFLFRRAAGEKKIAAKCCFTAILSGF